MGILRSKDYIEKLKSYYVIEKMLTAVQNQNDRIIDVQIAKPDDVVTDNDIIGCPLGFTNVECGGSGNIKNCPYSDKKSRCYKPRIEHIY